ncbi:flavin reductase family protein [Chloroflexota bacterium]
MKIDMANLDWRDAHEVVAASIVPRPIAFISTIGEDGIFNLAAFSFFVPVCCKPTLIGISASYKRTGEKKDTLVNIEATKEFVINVVDEALAEPMLHASIDYPSYVDEFKEVVGLTPVKADLVKAPMVVESPINMECRLSQILEFSEAGRKTSFIIGEVLRVHVMDELYVDGEIEPASWKAIARLGGEMYCRTRDVFEMKRPYVFG